MVANSTSLSREIEDERAQKGEAAWELCNDIAAMDDILGHVANMISTEVAGETRGIKLLYLVATSRLLDHPASVAVKGPSSSGKSYLVAKVLELFPPSAFLSLSGMSDKALAYLEQPLKHRCLVLAEAAGVTTDTADYFVRTLLSEGSIQYATVGKTEDGPKGRMQTLEGPTSLIVTTTEHSLHAENETRMLSLAVNDTREQTRAIMKITAARRNGQGGPPADKKPLVALQQWLESAEHEIIVPFAGQLAELIPPNATRLRRDFGTLLTLVASHALLHQTTRDRDSGGRIAATLEDYAAVRGLVSDLIAQQVELAVPPEVRETVEAVQALSNMDKTSVSAADVARHLDLDSSTGSRRVRQALGLGYLSNEETRLNRPFQLAKGQPLPTEVDVLPTVETLRSCACACPQARDDSPPPSVVPTHIEDEDSWHPFS